MRRVSRAVILFVSAAASWAGALSACAGAPGAAILTHDASAKIGWSDVKRQSPRAKKPASGPLVLVAERAAHKNSDSSTKYPDPISALQAGIESYRAGDAPSSVAAFASAAAGGQSLAQWKLGKMYAAGDGVPADDYKAYKYFHQIVESFDEEKTSPRQYQLVASAFVAVGVYSLNGIPKSEVAADPSRALSMFQYAAVHFGDPDAQYNLGRMYLDGAGVERDNRQGVRWLRLSADKGHAPSQALLGHLLFNGPQGVSTRRAQGLMYLTLARESATEGGKDAWIIELYDKAMAQASETERRTALADLEKFLRKR